jgi:hypothetical protein
MANVARAGGKTMRFGLVLALVLATMPVSASADDDVSTRDDSPRPAPDFLFGRPRISAGIRGSWLFARADSDWYRFVTGPDQLTIERSDFNAPGLAGTVGFAMSPRMAAVFDVEFTQTTVDSEYRNFVDNNRQPIAQTTRLNQVNLTGGVKVALTPRGRHISTYAWIPRTVVPYAGAGGGVLFYRLRQAGDFIDALTPQRSIFYDTFISSGWTPAAHVCGGVDVRVARSMYATLDVRYLWANGTMDRRQFIGFDSLDLAGLRTSAGVNFVF